VVLLTNGDAEGIPAALRTELLQASTLQAAAQRAMEHLHRNFAESVVLARTYATISYGALPARDRSFTRAVAAKHNQLDVLGDETPVLSLMGTAGVERAWCDRYES